MIMFTERDESKSRRKYKKLIFFYHVKSFSFALACHANTIMRALEVSDWEQVTETEAGQN